MILLSSEQAGCIDDMHKFSVSFGIFFTLHLKQHISLYERRKTIFYRTSQSANVNTLYSPGETQ
jgi:hypothetical protein